MTTRRTVTGTTAAAAVLLCVAAACAVAEARVDLKCAAGEQHPIVFFPGLFGSRLEERLNIPADVPMPSAKCLRTTSGWEPAWVEWKKMLPPANFDCFCERMRMHIDPAVRASTNIEGVEVRVPHWGTVASVDPLSAELGNIVRMYGPAMDTLKRMGYEENRTLFVAAYDWRRMPTPQWLADVRAMIEGAVQRSGKKAVVFSHSMGGPMSYMFLMAQTADWRAKYIHHYIPVSPVWSGTAIIPYAMVTNKIFNISGPYSQIGRLFRDLEGLYVLAPSVVFDPDTVIATTNVHTYTAANLSLLLERVGVRNADTITRNVQHLLNKYDYEHPGVPVTTIWSVSSQCLGSFHWKHDKDVGVQEPLPTIIEGDWLVPRASLEYAYKRWSSGPHAGLTRGFPLNKSNHASSTNDDRTMKLVFQAACDAAN